VPPVSVFQLDGDREGFSWRSLAYLGNDFRLGHAILPKWRTALGLEQPGSNGKYEENRIQVFHVRRYAMLIVEAPVWYEYW